VQLICSHLIHGLISLTSFPFFGYLMLHAVGEKETTFEQTSTDVVLLVVCISILCIGIHEIAS